MHELDIRLRLKDATYLLAQLRLQQAFAAWRRHAADVRRLERAEAAMAAAGRTWLLQLRFGRWLRTVQLLQGQRVAEMRQTVLARAALHMLKRYAAHRQRKAELISRADAAAAQLVKSKAVAAWQAAAQELRREAMEWRVVSDGRAQAQPLRAPFLWHDEAVSQATDNATACAVHAVCTFG